MFYKYENKNIKFARENRKQKNATPEEGKLWHLYLKEARYRFFRQFNIGNYILDFYCPEKGLCVEIDGDQHYDKEKNIEYDNERTKFLENLNIRVLRFYNSDINKKIKYVIENIDYILWENEK